VKLTFGDFALDSDTRLLLRGGKEVHLSPKAFGLLWTLVEAQPKALSKDQLQTMLWPGTFVTEGNLSVLVTEIRHALEDDAQAPRFIRTVQRFGYAFVGDAVDLPRSSAIGSGSGHWLVWGRQMLELPQGEVIVGRDPHCHVHLDVHGVSRRHARLRVSATQVTIEDLGSKNGSLKEGEPIAGVVVLEDNDRLQFGPLAVVYRYRPGLESTTSLEDLTDA
jgi:DNA-binding winged helix-turn-helix (wHTH) protein